MGAAEAPVADGDAFDEGLFQRAGGLEVRDEVGEKSVEILGALVGRGCLDDDSLGEQAVLEGVHGGTGFSLGRLGAGGALGVGAVGGGLFGAAVDIDGCSFGGGAWLVVTGPGAPGLDPQSMTDWKVGPRENDRLESRSHRA